VLWDSGCESQRQHLQYGVGIQLRCAIELLGLFLGLALCCRNMLQHTIEHIVPSHTSMAMLYPTSVNNVSTDKHITNNNTSSSK